MTEDEVLDRIKLAMANIRAALVERLGDAPDAAETLQRVDRLIAKLTLPGQDIQTLTAMLKELD
jgi:hypothetical protein